MKNLSRKSGLRSMPLVTKATSTIGTRPTGLLAFNLVATLALNLTIAIGLSLSTNKALADHTVGSGGDALRKLFEENRWAASKKVSEIKWCSFASGTNSVTSDWIIKNQSNLAFDISNSNHFWVVDSQATCGYTEHKMTAPIYLSYPTCAATVGTVANNAFFTLVHESAHHLGIANEKEADAVATAVLNANTSITCPASPGDVFYENVCQGPYFSAQDAAPMLPPGTLHATFGTYKMFGKSRKCSQISGCTNWFEDQVIGYLQGTPVLYVSATNSAPYFSLWMVSNPSGSSSNHYVFLNNGGGDVMNFYPGGQTRAQFFTEVGKNWVTMTSGSIRKECGWMKGAVKGPVSSAGQWTESEIVLYGTH